MNRLKLDFDLRYVDERKDFVEQYIEENFPDGRLSEKELETIANYILYGKERKGKNLVEKGEIEIETKYRTWDAQKKVESLDGLLESPTFNENKIRDGKTCYRTPKTVFSRFENSWIPELHPLWRQIDTIELTLNFYDLAAGKRKKEPRPELLGRFTDEEIREIRHKASLLPQYKVYKLRHLLVELRREQYTIRDSYVTEIKPHTPYLILPYEDEGIQFDNILPVLPLGLYYENHFSRKVFRRELDEENFKPNFLREVELLVREKQQIIQKYDCAHEPNEKVEKVEILPFQKEFIDFRNPQHIYNLFHFAIELSEKETEPESAIPDLIRTLDFYTDLADLTEIQKIILRRKKEKIRNQDIADEINSQFGKTYTSNYISTIFCQKICAKVAEAAEAHFEIIENLAYPESFKKCNTCGRILLRDKRNFVRKSRSSDGFSNRCKSCDRKDREEKKVEKIAEKISSKEQKEKKNDESKTV